MNKFLFITLKNVYDVTNSSSTKINHKNKNYLSEYLTIIPRARVGYEMIDSQRGAKRRVGYNHLISNKREWNHCFIKNNQEIL